MISIAESANVAALPSTSSWYAARVSATRASPARTAPTPVPRFATARRVAKARTRPSGPPTAATRAGPGSAAARLAGSASSPASGSPATQRIVVEPDVRNETALRRLRIEGFTFAA